jgi:hypothetical protein
MIFIDRESDSPPARASAFVMQESAGGRNILKIQEWSVDSSAAFAGMLSFFGTMRDQFSTLSIVAPADWQINRLLRSRRFRIGRWNMPRRRRAFIRGCRFGFSITGNIWNRCAGRRRHGAGDDRGGGMRGDYFAVYG